ncbi:MAG: peptidylprolyl isomerase [Candidatus Kapaibacteriales bacterium]
MKLLNLFFCIWITLILSLITLEAQEIILDKIVAIVGDEEIKLSDIKSQAYLFAQQDPSNDPNDPKFQRQILEQMINERLILIKARQDSIPVTDEEVNLRWDFQINALIQHYGSVSRIEEIYGMSLSQLKNTYKDEIRKSLLIEKMKEKKLGNITVTDREIKEFFEKFKDTLPQIPDQVELYHIVKNLQSSNEIRSNKFEFAQQIRDSIIKTGNFEDFARRYSDDKSTAPFGGDLGWVARGSLLPEFERVAFSLQKNEISKPFETPLGFHIVYLLNKNKDSIHVRHILFKLTPTEEDIQVIKEILQQIRKRVQNGESFEELAKKFSDEEETRGSGGFLGKFSIDELPQNIKEIIENLKEGEVSEPILYKTHPQESYRIIYKKKLISSHKINPLTDYKELEKYALAFKQNQIYQKWVSELRQQIYWEIKD